MLLTARLSRASYCDDRKSSVVESVDQLYLDALTRSLMETACAVQGYPSGGCNVKPAIA